MSNASVSLKPVKDLLGETFFVPAYQRGYRWKGEQIQELLDDILEFHKTSNASSSDFYCLQPIVVKRNTDTGSWELVDGQQRLTTLLLILRYFNRRMTEEFKKPLYRLTFETRPAFEEFLENLTHEGASGNIDFFHIYGAIQKIRAWFEPHQTIANDIESTLLNRTKVIWYELPAMEDSVAAFTRLNVGKIPLTNAELIRALFLRSENFQSNVSLQQIRIAQEWDGIEKILQREDVWHFLYGGFESPPTRIDYLFKLIAEEKADGDLAAEGELRTFHFYNDKFDRAANAELEVEFEWLEVKKYFMALEEWFHNRTLYHLIGYLVHTGDSLLQIRKVAGSLRKSEFQRALRKRIYARLITDDTDGSEAEAVEKIKEAAGDLEYGQRDRADIRAFLLLFNIASLLENASSNLRFPFDSFKRQNWDIEHVRSVESSKPTGSENQKRWLEQAQGCLGGNETDPLLSEKIEKAKEKKLKTEHFDELYHELLVRFGENKVRDTDNSISNLALLDAATNRSYKNALFPVKRREILKQDKEGIFVPLCTKNLFLKCYSKQSRDIMFWSEDDGEDYFNDIAGTLARFFKTNGDTP